MRVGEFEFKGLPSTDFSLVSRSVKRRMLPALRSRLSEVPGKHGVIDSFNNKYQACEIIMYIAYIGQNFFELRGRSREIAAWLTTEEWSKLVINDEPDKYYLARVYEELDLKTLQRLGQCEVTFLCQPFAYHVVSTSDDPTWEEADFPWLVDMTWEMAAAYQFTATGTTNFEFESQGTTQIDNDSPQGSRFKIAITGSWTTLGLAMNGKILSYTEAGSGELIIDNVEMEVTLDGANVLDAVTGDLDSFLFVISGENSIQVTGTEINISVQLDFIPMWL